MNVPNGLLRVPPRKGRFFFGYNMSAVFALVTVGAFEKTP